MKRPAIRIYTTSWCGDSFRAKTYLESHGVKFEEIDIERSEGGLKAVIDANEGRRKTPTFEIGGKFYGNPPITELARLVGIEKTSSEGPRASR